MATGDADNPKTTDPDKNEADDSERDSHSQQERPGPKKISEKPDYLKQREDWFRKRSS